MGLHGEPRRRGGGGGIGILLSGGFWRGVVEVSRDVVVVVGEPGPAPLVDALWPCPSLCLCLGRLGHVAGGAGDGEVAVMLVGVVGVAG